MPMCQGKDSGLCQNRLEPTENTARGGRVERVRGVRTGEPGSKPRIPRKPTSQKQGPQRCATAPSKVKHVLLKCICILNLVPSTKANYFI